MRLSRASQNKIDALARVAFDPNRKSADVAFYKRELEKHVGQLEATIGSMGIAQQKQAAKDARSKRAARSREIEEAHIVVLQKGVGK